MTNLFPLDQPGPTQLYLLLYIVTFALHQVFMHNVLAGSLWLAGRSVWHHQDNALDATGIRDDAMTELVRDWMPFQLSAAITAGVAPLLFIQILYPEHFYTANLLLWWRWMIVVPVLIVAFYLMYVAKSRLVTRSHRGVRILCTSSIAAMILFVGFCWTGNYLVSVQPSEWPEIYERGAPRLERVSLLLRMGIWIFGSFATLGWFIAWQTRWQPKEVAPSVFFSPSLIRLAMAGIAGSAISTVGYLWSMDALQRDAVLSASGWVYLVVGATGAVTQWGAWISILRSRQPHGIRLFILSLGYVLSLMGLVGLREIVRLASLDMTPLYPLHAEAAQVGGFTVFLGFSVLNAILIGGCVWLVRNSR